MLLLARGAPRAGSVSDSSPPGAQLLARVEAHLEARKPALRQTLEHYALVYDDVGQDDLHSYLEPIRFFWLGDGFALGSAYGLEPHGGGILRLIWTHWRPDGRPARASDAFPFQLGRQRLELGKLYESHRRQVFLPVPGKAPEQIAGELPTNGQLPRMRFAGSDWPGATALPDAYHFLRLLIEREPDYHATWTNQLGQTLSTERLLQSTRDFYLESDVADLEPEDHSALHLVETLLAFRHLRGERGAAAPRSPGADAIKKRFLAIELSRTDFPERDETLLLGHYAESLGILLADSEVTWSADEKRKVRQWLHALERDRFQDLAAVKPNRLSHLLLGLRLIGEHADELRETAWP